MEKRIFQFFIFLSSTLPLFKIFINCQQSSPDNEEFPQEKQLNKFIYHLQKPEEIKNEIKTSSSSPSSTNSLFFPLKRKTGLSGLPPSSLVHSNGLLLPNPAQLPSIFRLSATAMSQSQAFSLNSSNLINPLIEKLTTQKSFEKTIISTQIKETTTLPTTTIIENNQNINLINSSSISLIENEILTNNINSSSNLNNSNINLTQYSQIPSTLDFETFLQSFNISDKYKKEFLFFMENEISRRLESRLNENQNEEKMLIKNPIFEEKQRKPEEEDENIKKEINNNFGSRIFSDFSRKSELHTVNTRLFSLASGSSKELIGNEQQNDKKTFVDLFNSEEENNNTLNNNNNENNYRKREQEEFDKLLSKLNEETNNNNNKKEEIINENDYLFSSSSLIKPPNLATTFISTLIESTTIINNKNENKQLIIETNQINDRNRAKMMLNRHKFWSRHNPKTKFEHLVDDYRFRLIGQGDNGLNGLFRALRNGHIALFNNRMTENEERKNSFLRKIE